MIGERQDQVVASLWDAFQEEADRAIAEADVGSAFVEFGARLRRDRHYRAVRAIAACLALLAGMVAAIGVAHRGFASGRRSSLLQIREVRGCRGSIAIAP